MQPELAAKCSARPAVLADAPDIRRVYNSGIDSRQATFETQPRSLANIEAWFADDLPLNGAYVAAELVGFAVVTPYSERDCYSGVGEFSIYVDSQYAGKGIGKILLSSLIESAEDKGFWKLLSRVFPENIRCRRLLKRSGFREVGVYENHAQLCGEWRDVVIVERLLGDSGGSPK